MREDKQKTCDLLLPALQATRQYWDLIRLEYSKSDSAEIVTAVFMNGYRKPINVALDSGSAMIRDIVRALA